jgi:hypothetical protein
MRKVVVGDGQRAHVRTAERRAGGKQRREQVVSRRIVYALTILPRVALLIPVYVAFSVAHCAYVIWFWAATGKDAMDEEQPSPMKWLFTGWRERVWRWPLPTD